MKRFPILASALLLLGMAGCQKDQTDQVLNQAEEYVSSQTGAIIPGQYIVLLNEVQTGLKSTGLQYPANLQRVSREAMTLLERANIETRELIHVYGSAVEGFAIQMEEEEVKSLSDRPEVKGIWPDRVVVLKKPGTTPGTPPAETIPYGIARVGYGTYSGSGKAWIIDTGIDLDHPDLNVDKDLSKTFVVRTSSADDDNGHGSHCAGIVAAIDNEIGVVGVAAGARLVAIKVLDRRGSGAISGVIAGVDHVAAYANTGDVANLSLGGSAYDPLDQAVIALGGNGVFVALAAGNESDNANNHSPARANGPNLYTVSACNNTDTWAYFSNYGNPPIDYCAPGVSIFSTYKGGSYTSMSGTSMAAPHVCGLLLLTNGNIKTDGFVEGDPDGNPDPIAHK